MSPPISVGPNSRRSNVIVRRNHELPSPTMRLIWKIVLPLLIVALAVGTAVILIRNRPAPHRAPVVVMPPTIAVAIARPQDRRIDVRTHGTVQARATSVL